MTTFAELGASETSLAALADLGITEPFPIQALAIPLALKGGDVTGQARTGSGKTVAFGIPLMQRLGPPQQRPQALVVVPTRELCVQVSEVLATLGRRAGVRVTAIYGGRAMEPQVETLRRGVDIVVGTPGRLLDLARQRHLDLSQVAMLVLDEADEMLDLGFLPDIERILAMTPGDRQTLLFSATMPGPILTLARRFLRTPVHLRAEAADEQQTVPTTQQHVFRAHALDKPEMLARVLQAGERGLTLVFCRTKRGADKLGADLSGRGFAAAAVHGDLTQGAREQAVRAFRAGKVDVLVATDVAARGIDISGITHVVNYQCPDDEKTYLHRIGRTGRAGAAGVAVTFVDWDDLPKWSLINTALNLPFPDPAETYSNSPQLYEALDIPRGARGSLPKHQRTRAGLAAEVVEDIGGRAPRTAAPRHKDQRPARDGRGGTRPVRSTAPSSDPAPPAPRDASGAPPRRRPRSRTRRGGSAGGSGTTGA